MKSLPIPPHVSGFSVFSFQFSLFLLLAVVGLLTRDVCAGDGSRVVHCTQKTLIPGTVYYFPDGRASNDSAWVNIGSFGKQASYHSLGIVVDSTTGFDDPCTLRVEGIYGFDGTFTGDTMRVDTVGFLGNPTTSVVFNDDFHVVPEDTAYNISCGLYLHEEHRWRVTVSDSCTLTLIEYRGKP